MKKLLLLALAILFVFCGCSDVDDLSNENTITINTPSDNDVNGYRTEDYVDSESVSFNDVKPSENIPETYNYCGNKNSKKFHKIDCTALQSTKEENKVYYKTREEFFNKGFAKCGICNP